MRFITSIIFLLFLLNVKAQDTTHLYVLHGQGSDHRLFDSLVFPSNYKVHFINYGMPEKDWNMHDFARVLSQQIDTTQNFSLLGVSMGGMLCAEMAEFLNPQKVILISSANCREDLPFRYQFQSKLPLYKIIPKSLMFAGAKFLQPLVEPDRKANKATFKSMLSAKNALYIKRTVAMIINWEKTEHNPDIIHIHGTKDHTLPHRKLKRVDYTIAKGSHMMTLTDFKKVQQVLDGIL
ncbi:BAAT / Acyl-CoA thioester hydrolase C terminal [Lishizhenia tianjinensis]|uniref:BAAT / Acyl-CoA thioester hydrolase C terminal n=1 Tax=Lishizhenia tianjinensis TaxID=477690 RepID=A0A1I7BC76_9FLAO|nr:alpha/beta hydrolase [Lishizhenia tianjinensis]SFT84741.1 BAAT / Acyl-CoA thioester hydrolase C terminal [Lishizhenia tianjinensis]